MQRRDFLKGMLALGMAPAIVKAENLMKIWVPPEPAGWSTSGYLSMPYNSGLDPGDGDFSLTSWTVFTRDEWLTSESLTVIVPRANKQYQIEYEHRRVENGFTKTGHVKKIVMPDEFGRISIVEGVSFKIPESMS